MNQSHHVDMPPELAAIGEHYLALLDSSKDTSPERYLLTSFGDLSPRTIGHQRAVWLCLLAIRRALNVGGVPDAELMLELEPAFELITAWIEGRHDLAPSEWEMICHVDAGVISEKHRSEEQFQRRSVFRAVAAAARFALYAGIWDGTEALEFAGFADCDYAREQCRQMTYHKWLAAIALPAAYNLREFSGVQLNPKDENMI